MRKDIAKLISTESDGEFHAALILLETDEVVVEEVHVQSTLQEPT